MREHTPGEPVHYSPKGGVPYRDGLYVSTDIKGRHVVKDAQTGQEHTIGSARVKFLDDECAAATGRQPVRGVSHFVEPMTFAPTSLPEHPIDAVLRRVDKPRPRHRDRGYLAFVRDHACCCCNAPGPSDPHHWSATIRRGVGQKLDDLLTVPLCRACHDTYHRRNALPGMLEAETTLRLLGVQVELLVNWIAERKLADALDSAGEEPI